MIAAHQRKKVLYLITKSNWGGAQRYVYDLATNLDPHEWEAVVASGTPGVLTDMLDHAGIPTHEVPALRNELSLRYAWRAGRSLYRFLRSERPDVLHLNSSVAGLLGTIVGRLARVPKIIFTCHGWAFNEDRGSGERLLLKTLHWLTVLLSHRTIAVSNGVLQQMHWPLAWRRMKVLNPGRSIGAMYERAEAREKICDFFPRLCPYRDDPWVVCLAELHPIKRHQVLFNAFVPLIKKHPTTRLVCIGEGILRTVLTEYIEKNNLSEHVFLLGNLTEAARFLKAFDTLTLTSKSESYGYVLHEAGLAGVPVVATAVGGIPDIVTDGETGLLVAPDDAPALTTALCEQLEDTTKALSMASQAKAHLAARTVETMVRATETLYLR